MSVDQRTTTLDWQQLADGDTIELPTSGYRVSIESVRVRFRGIEYYDEFESFTQNYESQTRSIENPDSKYQISLDTEAPDIPDGAYFDYVDTIFNYTDRGFVEEDAVYEEPDYIGEGALFVSYYQDDDADIDPYEATSELIVRTWYTEITEWTTTDPTVEAVETSDTFAHDGELADAETTEWQDLDIDSDGTTLAISTEEESEVEVQIEYEAIYDPEHWRLADFGTEEDPDNGIWWWRGWTFEVAQPVEAIGLYGGHTGAAEGDAWVALYEADDDDAPQELLASSLVNDARRELHEVSETLLEPDQRYIIAQGSEERADGHYRVDVTDDPAYHEHISEAEGPFVWSTGGDETAILTEDPSGSADPDQTPDIGIQFDVDQRPEAIAIVELEADVEVVQLPLVDPDDEQLEHDGVETVHPDDPEQVLAADLVEPENEEASAVELPTSEGVLAWREHQE